MRRALVAVGLVVALVAGACGNGDGDASSSSGDLPLLPSSGGGDEGAAAAETASGSATGGSATTGDATITRIAPSGPYQPIEYRLADGIDPMGGEGGAYRLDAVVDEAVVKKLAAAFGIDGVPKEQRGYWTVGDPATKALQVDAAGMFNVHDNTTSQTAEASAVCSSDGHCDAPAPTAPPKPANLPSDDAAKEAATELFERAGIDVEASVVLVDRSDYYVSVAMQPSLDGAEVEGWGFVATFGDNAELQYASGSLARPSKIGDYPLVDTEAAYERWTSGMGGDRVGVAVDTVEPAPAVGAPEPAVGMPAYGTAPETVPTLPPKIVEIDRVEQVLLTEYARCPGEPMYLVPGYRLYAGDEPYATIPAVAGEYLQTGSGDEPAASDADGDGELVEPCGNVVGGEPGREPDGPPVTDGGFGGYPPITIE